MIAASINRLPYFWLLALNFFLLMPLVNNLKVTDGFSGIYDFVVIWNVACSIFVLLTLHIIVKRPVIIHALMAPLYITTAIDVYLVIFYDARLSSGYIWIIIANTHDALDYFQDFQGPILVSMTTFSLVYIIGLWKIRSLRFDFDRSLPLILLSLVILAVLYPGVAARQAIKHDLGSFSKGFADILEMDLSAPTGVIAQGYVVYASMQKHRFDQEMRGDFTFGASQRSSHANRPEILVVVIGESARPDRLTINGYHRDTTPNLSNIDNLISFADVVTEWPLTQASVPIMLSRATAREFDRALQEKSIVAALGEAGFATHWLTVQPFSDYGGIIHVLAGDADRVRYLNRVHDEILLDALDEALGEAVAADRKAAVFIHTLGSHQSYSNRYPPGFSFFEDVGDDLTYKEKIDNTYDNSLRYTDWFLSEIIERLQMSDAISSMLYVSDHGENLLDDERGILGHNFGTVYDFSIPLILWYSDEYLETYPEKIEHALENMGSKLSTSNMFESLADIADLRFDGFRSERSFVNSAFKETPRIVYRQNEDSFFDFDAPGKSLMVDIDGVNVQ